MKKRSFLKRLLITVIILSVIAVAAYLLQLFFGIFDKPFADLRHYLAMADKMVVEQWVTGISVGTILGVILLLVIPIFSRNIDTRSYFKNIYTGIISSLIFYISNIAYGFIEKINKFYLFLSIIAVIIIAFILIQIIAGMFRKDNGVQFRTDVVSGITAGLIFGVLLKLIFIGVDMVKVKI
jgi:hypothetical protein